MICENCQIDLTPKTGPKTPDVEYFGEFEQYRKVTCPDCDGVLYSGP